MSPAARPHRLSPSRRPPRRRVPWRTDVSVGLAVWLAAASLAALAWVLVSMTS